MGGKVGYSPTKSLKRQIWNARRDLVRKCKRCEGRGICKKTGKLCRGARELWKKLDSMENSGPEVIMSPDSLTPRMDRME